MSDKPQFVDTFGEADERPIKARTAVNVSRQLDEMKGSGVTAKRLWNRAPRCRSTATLGMRSGSVLNPVGVAPFLANQSQGSRDARQPWAAFRNRFAVVGFEADRHSGIGCSCWEQSTAKLRRNRIQFQTGSGELSVRVGKLCGRGKFAGIDLPMS